MISKAEEKVHPDWPGEQKRAGVRESRQEDNKYKGRRKGVVGTESESKYKRDLKGKGKKKVLPDWPGVWGSR